MLVLIFLLCLTLIIIIVTILLLTSLTSPQSSSSWWPRWSTCWSWSWRSSSSAGRPSSHTTCSQPLSSWDLAIQAGKSHHYLLDRNVCVIFKQITKHSITGTGRTKHLKTTLSLLSYLNRLCNNILSNILRNKFTFSSVRNIGKIMTI